MDRVGLGAGHEAGRIAVALEQRCELLLRDAGEDRGVGDLVAVEVQDGQHRPVAGGVQELVRVPAGRQRPGLGLAVADDHADEQVGVVERRSVGMDECVTELPALVDRSGRLGGHVAGHSPREGELAEQAPQALLVAAHVGIDLAVGALEVDVREHSRTPVAGPGDEDRVQVPRADDAVHVGIEEVQPGGRAPVPEQAGLDVLDAAGARAGAGCRAGRSARPRGSWPRASRRSAVAAPRRPAARERQGPPARGRGSASRHFGGGSWCRGFGLREGSETGAWGARDRVDNPVYRMLAAATQPARRLAMFRNALVGVDGSPFGRDAVALASRLLADGGQPDARPRPPGSPASAARGHSRDSWTRSARPPRSCCWRSVSRPASRPS